MLKKKTSSPLDFSKMDIETLNMYSDFYTDKIDEGEPMDAYYRNMLYLVSLEIGKRVYKKYNK